MALAVERRDRLGRSRLE